MRLRLIMPVIVALTALPAAAGGETEAREHTSTRAERNHIVEGNKLYRAERYAEAEVEYRKALQENAMNEIAQFNLASALLRSGSNSPETVKEATTILQSLARNAEDIAMAERSFYNLGNLAFNSQDYAKAVDNYKNALRRNPDNDDARDNLRLAQKRLEQQNQDDQNQDQNKDQDKKDQDKKDQQQNQDKDNNKDQDKNKDQNQDQDQQQQQQQQDQQQQNQQQQQQGGISKQNAEKILKAMENEEAATRQRIQAEKAKKGAPQRRPITNPW